MKKFFENNKTAIQKFIDFVKKIKDKEEHKEDCGKYNLELCAQLLDEIINKKALSPFGIEGKIAFNVEHIGKNFIDNISATSYDTDTYETVVIFLIRIVREYQLKTDTQLPESAKKLLTIFAKESSTFSEDLNTQIYYTFNKMPFQITEDNFNKKLEAINNSIGQTVKDTVVNELPKETEKIEALKEYIGKAQKLLEEQKEKFSFVLLNQAFSNLENSKVISKRFALGLLIVLGIVIVLIPYVYYKELFYIKEISEAFNELFKTKIDFSQNNSSVLVIMFIGLIPMVLIETLCIYFFRIVLHKYNSLVDQIVQLETKQAIVQFIESYVDYKKDKNLTNEELSKFEEIVFSKISPNLKDIPDSPSVIALVEGIAKAMKK
jgi:hypothetical protein